MFAKSIIFGVAISTVVIAGSSADAQLTPISDLYSTGVYGGLNSGGPTYTPLPGGAYDHNYSLIPFPPPSGSPTGSLVTYVPPYPGQGCLVLR